jgi:hypothetical protein
VPGFEVSASVYPIKATEPATTVAQTVDYQDYLVFDSWNDVIDLKVL